MNHRTTFAYDAVGRQITVEDALNGVTSSVYDAVGNKINVIDPVGNTTTFAYDGLGRETQRFDANGHSATFAYDGLGRLTSSTDRLGRRRDFQYDAVGQLTQEVWYDEQGSAVETLTYSYDDAGNQLTAGDSDGTYTLTYDALGRVLVSQDLWGHTLTFTYDAAGNRTRVEDSEGGVTTSLYNAGNQLTGRAFDDGTTYVRVEWAYTGVYLVAQVQRFDAPASPGTPIATSQYTYDGNHHILTIHHSKDGGGNLGYYTYTYDQAGRLTAEEYNGTFTSYSYDDTDQLTADGNSTFTYDANGNRTNTGYVTGTGNRLENDGTWTYTYDAEGNLIKKSKGAENETWTYGYDHRNQLIWVEQRAIDGGEAEVRIEYDYDVFGNRIEKRIDSDGDSNFDTIQRYAYDGWNPARGTPVGNENWDVWADFDGTDTLETRYVRGDAVDELMARIDASGDTYWTLTDRLGSVRTEVDNDGVIQGTVAYDGFGNITSESGDIGRYRWTGREYDAETGLQYNRARYYLAEVARWLSEDPLGFEAGDANLYRYVGNAPLATTDPSGLKWQFLSVDSKEVITDGSLAALDAEAKQGTPYTDMLNGFQVTVEKFWKVKRRVDARFPRVRNLGDWLVCDVKVGATKARISYIPIFVQWDLVPDGDDGGPLPIVFSEEYATLIVNGETMSNRKRSEETYSWKEKPGWVASFELKRRTKEGKPITRIIFFDAPGGPNGPVDSDATASVTTEYHVGLRRAGSNRNEAFTSFFGTIKRRFSNSTISWEIDKEDSQPMNAIIFAKSDTAEFGTYPPPPR